MAIITAGLVLKVIRVKKHLHKGLGLKQATKLEDLRLVDYRYFLTQVTKANPSNREDSL